MDNIFINKYSTICRGEKYCRNSVFVDKKREKNGVIHNISTKCGYMDSNNVEMWITMGGTIYSKKKFCLSIC